MESVLKKKGRLLWEGFAEKGAFKTEMKVRGDGIVMMIRIRDRIKFYS